MNRDELLRLAAKAIDRDPDERVTETVPCDPQSWSRAWAPLDHDGDALQLAVKLGMLHIGGGSFHGFQRRYVEALAEDLRPSEATRRAIVETAAHIGDQK